MNEFLKSVKDNVEKFKDLKERTVKLVSHLDSDGLSSSAIMIKALRRNGIKFSLTTIRQLDDLVLDEISRENCEVVFFLDLGSGNIDKIEQLLKDKEVFILDHHTITGKVKNVNLINPMLHGVDGNSEISGAGICYFFAKALNFDNIDMAHIAILGAIGDMQENNGFHSELNNYILDDSVNAGKVEVKIGLRMFGMQTRPLDKMLEYATDPYIPGVTGNQEGARKFIDGLNIDAKLNGQYKKLVQLKFDDLKKLITGIIIKRLGSEEKPEDVLGKIYLLKEENDESPTRDAKEFSTLLNSCGRLNRPALGIGCCLGDGNLKKEAMSLLLEYKKEIINSLNWFHNNKERVIKGDGYVIINVGSNIRDTMIGTMASIISKSNIYEEDTVIISMAYTMDGHIKVSIRSVNNKEVDLREIISRIVEKTGGICGGHKSAAGALITQDKEEEFIKTASEELNKLFILK